MNSTKFPRSWLTRFGVAWRPNAFLTGLRRQTPLAWVWRYGLAVGAPAAGMGLRLALTAWIGHGLATYITFYPAVMVVALLAGFGPGLLTTALVDLLVCYWILPPVGQFAVASPVDRLGLVIFAGMGLLMSVVARFYQRTQEKAAAYDRESAVRETLREKEFLADLLERASQPFAVGYPDGRIGRLNGAYERLTGYCAAELRALDWSSVLTPPEWRELEKQKLDELHRTGQAVRYEKEYLRKDGTRVPIELLVHLVKDRDGKPEYYYSFLTDITQRKQAEEALRRSEQRYHSLFNTLMEGFCIIEVVFDDGGRPVDYRFLEVNPAFEKQTGLHNAQGKLMRDLAPDHEAHWFEIYGRIVLTGEPARFENEARALGRWYEVSAFRLGGPESRKVAILFNDVTESRRAGAAVRESEERLRFALETSRTGAWDLDLVDHTAFRSLEHDRIFGYAALLPQWTYETFLEHVLPEDRATVDGRFRQAMERKGDWDFECRIRRADGQSRWIWSAGRHRKDAAGVTRRMAGVVQDITERKRAEEQTRHLNEVVAQERDRLSALVNSISDEIWFADMNGRFTLVNPSASSEFGLGTTGAIDARKLASGLEVRRPDGSPRPIEEAPPLRALRGERVRNLEEMVRTPATNELKFRQVNASPVKNAAGAIIGSVSVVRDITELKRAEEALRSSEERLRLAQESANVGIWDWKVETGALDFTPELNKLYGLPAGTIQTYQDWRARVHPDDIGRIEVLRDEAIAKHEPFDLEFRGRHSSGEYRWISTKGGALYDEMGKAARVFGVNIDITDRKQAEAALGESEARFRTMANAIPQLAWIARPDGHIFWYNQRWYDYTGTIPEQMEGWGWQSVHDPLELPKVLERRKASIATGEPFEMIFPLRGADGSFRLFLTRGFPLKDAAGRLVQWFGTNTDVNELKRVEEALRESEDRLRQLNTELEQRVARQTAEARAASLYARNLLEAGLDSLVTINAEGKITDVNEASVQATGVPRERLVGTDFSNYFTEPDEARASYQRVFAEGFVRDYPLTIRHASGRTTDVLYNATLYRNETGEVQGVFAAARDVTERKRMEEELKAVSRYARSLIEASLDPLVTISAEGKVTDVNEASVQATGVPREQLIGTDFSNYFTEPDKARAGYRRAFAEGLVRDYPLAVRHTSGGTTDVLYNATVYRNEAGKVQGVFAAARDVTERKRAETELARYRDHLEELVKLRTGQLETANLQLQREIAERKHAAERLRRTAADLTRSNQELEQFAYVASHDLQEPLRAVAGYLGLIEARFGGQLDDKGRHHIAGAIQGAQRMHALITDLLMLSRVGTQGHAFEPAALDAVLEVALSSLRTSIQEAGAEVTHDPLPRLSVDATQMALLFQNLIGNAIKFRSDQPPAIHVSAQRQAEQWVIAVRDNGIGMEPQYFDRIFLIFQRLHTRKQYPGTGIGLAVCKKIAERHGGTIWVESQPGQGSTFYFTIPDRGV
jgi:PAS domain S-box-containing protein